MRLIDADALIQQWNGCVYEGTVGSLLNTAPTIEPELILCKDCKHMIEHKLYGNLGESAYTCEGNMGGWVLPDSYCSMARRREDG